MGDSETERKDSGFSSLPGAIRSAGPLIGSGIQLATSVVVMFFLGRWLDDRFGTSPWLMIVGTFLGLGAGLFSFIKTIITMDSKEKEERNDRNEKH
jgi:ATP synthase protein I